MMRKYLKESLHWLHLAFFKPITLKAEASGLTRRQARRVYLKVLPVQLAIVLLLVPVVGILSQFAAHSFSWSKALVGLLLFELVFGLFGERPEKLDVWFGLLGGLIGGVIGGLAFEVDVWVVGWLWVGLGVGLVFGLSFGLSFGLGFGLHSPVGREILPGLVGGLVICVSGVLLALVGDVDKRMTGAFWFGMGYSVGFLFIYLRLFHLIPYAVQRRRSKKATDPFPFFRNSPVYWDEAIAMPLPFLSDWLVELARFDRERSMSEIANVARLPYQRRAAQRALVKILVHDLQQTDGLERMASAPEVLETLFSNAEFLPRGSYHTARHILRVGDLASDYLTRRTPVGQINVLADLRAAIESFRDAMILIDPPVGPALQSAASRWLEIVKAEEVRVRKRMVAEPIPNPFVVGNPLMVRDHNLFKGRKDIIVAIEENIINPAQRPALLLYGRRRIGKTSTLLNLPRLLSSRFVPVFIDCQDAKWREGDEAFCYHLAASIHDALNQRALVKTASRPQLERFARYAFTRLGEYLDQIEESSRSTHKQILLTFDEYEKLEDGISASKLTTEVLNQLRTIVQHRERIVVLFSGSHRFEEMKTINWSDYLINVKTLELSFLAPEDARELITEPVPLLQYESGVIEQIIELTHCQPYLLQAVASDLVNYLNSEGRMLATAADLEVAVEKVLITAQAYFFYTWTGDCTEAEREVLRMIATGNTNNQTLAERQASLQSLCQKEILEREGSGYRFSIELFRRWVLKNQTAQPFIPGDLPETAEIEYADLLTTHT
jgi:hypothetical protein